ncbi:MAG: hypothetical protein AB4911_20060, partial [Oscillochloridaceae bacterium umkhey_bin13]
MSQRPTLLKFMLIGLVLLGIAACGSGAGTSPNGASPNPIAELPTLVPLSLTPARLPTSTPAPTMVNLAALPAFEAAREDLAAQRYEQAVGKLRPLLLDAQRRNDPREANEIT